jgi:hypothetical protein
LFIGERISHVLRESSRFLTECFFPFRSIGANMEQHEHRDGVIPEGDSSFVDNSCPSSSEMNCGMSEINRNFSKSTIWPLAFWLSIALIGLSLGGSCLIAPFLVPDFQLHLVLPILVAMALGAIGGICRAWWLTGIGWSSLVLLYVWDDLETKPYGFRSLYSMPPGRSPGRVHLVEFIRGTSPAKVQIFPWLQLYDITIIPLTLGVAVLTYGLIADFRRRRAEAREFRLPEVALLRKNGRSSSAITAEPDCPPGSVSSDFTDDPEEDFGDVSQ